MGPDISLFLWFCSHVTNYHVIKFITWLSFVMNSSAQYQFLGADVDTAVLTSVLKYWIK